MRLDLQLQHIELRLGQLARQLALTRLGRERLEEEMAQLREVANAHHADLVSWLDAKAL